MLRRRTITRLGRDAHHTLDRLYARAGAAYAPAHERLFPYTTHDTFRIGIFQATWGHLPYLSPFPHS